MHITKQITGDIVWVGADDRRLAMFEGVYSVPDGVSYNSYLVLDETTVLFDTVDKAVERVFFQNLQHALGGRKLDYVVVQHMEPDHSASLLLLLERYPETVVVCTQKTAAMIQQFFGLDVSSRAYVVKEGDTLSTGRHVFTFVMAPMVHWPEVMVTYDKTEKILFSADAFGTFGALNGAIFADEVDFARDYLDEARRYYCNIVGKYGAQVQALLRKASALEIKMICPLHGFVFRRDIGAYVEKYDLWSRYAPEEQGVMIAYASIYGNTENAANALACRLRDRGVKTAMYDVSVTPASEIVAAAFRWSHLVFASATYNAGIFVSMEALLHDIAAHGLANRTVAFIENGSWAPASAAQMREILSKLKNITFLEPKITLRSALTPQQANELDAMADALCGGLPAAQASQALQAPAATVDPKAFFQLSYGLFVLTARDGEKDNGCIINACLQLTDTPKRIGIAVNKANYTHALIEKTGVFNISVLTEEAPFSVYQNFGMRSGREADKFAGLPVKRTANGVRALSENVCAVLSGRVIAAQDCGTHTFFVADVTEASVLPGGNPVTYAYYFAHVKPAPQPAKKKGFVCRICGYVYEGETLPPDFICPLCKHGAEDFEPLG